MTFHDPLTELALRLQPGWAYDADTATLDTASFRCWNGDMIRVSSAPSAAAASSDDEWARSQEQPDATPAPVEPPWTHAPAVEFLTDGQRTVVVRAVRLDLTLRWSTAAQAADAWPLLWLQVPERVPPGPEEAATAADELAANADGVELEWLARRLPASERSVRLLEQARELQANAGLLSTAVSAHDPAIRWAAARAVNASGAVEAARENMDWAAMRAAAMAFHDDLVVLTQLEDRRPGLLRELSSCLSSWFGAALVRGITSETLLATECIVAVADALLTLENSGPTALTRAAEARLLVARAILELQDEESVERAASLVEDARRILRRVPDAGDAVGHARLLESEVLQTRGKFKLALAALGHAHVAASDPSLLALIAAKEQELRALSHAGLEPLPLPQTADPDVLITLANSLMIAGQLDAALEHAAAALPKALEDPAGGALPRALAIGATALRGFDADLAGALLLTAEAVLDLRATTTGSAEDRLAASGGRFETTIRGMAVDLLFSEQNAEWGVAALDRARGAVLRARIAAQPVATDIAPDARTTPPPLTGIPVERFRQAAAFAFTSVGELLHERGVLAALAPHELQQLVDESGYRVLMLHPVGESVAVVVLAPSQQPFVMASPASRDEVTKIASALRTAVAAFADVRVSGADWSTAAGWHRDAIRKAWEALIEPVEQRVQDGDELVVAPTAELGLIPFAALGAGDDALVERVGLSLVPSLGVLAALRARRAAQRWPARAYVVGEPRLDPELERSLGLLPHARSEAEAVAAALDACQGMRVVRHLGPYATEDAYRANAPGCDLLHLACHAHVRTPASESALFLAAKSRDGVLSGREVERIPMNGGLAYLSACETASGRPSTDGIIGLARSYLIAGANAVVATLWQVDDLAAATMSRHFYAALLEEGMSVAQSARHAALRTRADLREGRLVGATGEALPEIPLLWAAHVVVGDASLRRRANGLRG